MKNRVFTGAGVAIVTPMNEDGTVNYSKLEELINWQIDNDTDSIVICGTTGEASTLTHEEHIKCMACAVDTVKKHKRKVPVIAGTGSNDTAYAIELTKEAKSLGADATLQVTPYYNKTSQKGLITHFNAIADCTDLPVILYNVPSRTNLSITAKTYLELSRHENIVATKEASGNMTLIAQTKALCGDNLDIYSGNDDQIVPILSLGGIGVISVLSNVRPRETHEIVSKFLSGDVNGSLKLQLEYMSLIDALFMDVSPMPVKEMLNLMGKNAGACRLPLSCVDEDLRNILKQFV